ncbi:MAG: DNA polymerase A family protein, partial [Candidatus Izemoplasmatales bacterium]
MLRAADNRGRISTSYNLTGTVTGRTASGKEKMAATSARSRKSADGMNLQNIIRDSYGEEEASIRDIIVARHGWSIVEVDFSQIELRVAGWLSRDPFFLDAYARGMDIHTLTAQMIMGLTEEQWAKLPKEKQKEYRQRAKAVNFGFLYGMGARTFQQYALTDYGVEFTLDECYKIREKYFEEHTGLEPWYLRQERQALRLGYVESPSGRRRHLPNINLDPQSSKEARRKYQEAVRYAINMPVQGFASDLKLMSAIEIDGLLYEDEAYMFGEVHDSILFEIRNDCIDYYVPKIVNVMRHPEMLDRLGIDLTVPIDAEAKVGQSWGKAKVYAVAA